MRVSSRHFLTSQLLFLYLFVFIYLSVKRQSIPIRRVALTDMRLKIPRGVRSSTLRKALEKDDIIKKFNETAWGKKRLAKQRRAALTDFERFKVMVARKQRAQAVRSKLSKK